MIMTGESRIIGRKTCPTVISSITNLTWNDLVSKLGLHGERPTAKRLNLSFIYRSLSYRTVNNLLPIYKR